MLKYYLNAKDARGKMTYVLFLHTIVLTLLFGAYGFVYLALYSRNKLRHDLWVAIMFLFFT